MSAPQRIIRERRQYNQWVATQTLEDYALRYTAERARRSSFRVGNTALGPISFLACEAIGGAITLSYGFHTAWCAIAVFSVLMFLIGLPIAYYAARYGVDIDLLTRGAGFGYMGSTITSLIYASFTFILFSIEASIMSLALRLLFDIPLWLAHLVSSLMVIPIAIYGFSRISRMQLLTQPVWLLLQFVPVAYIVWKNPAELQGWTQFTGSQGSTDGTLNMVLFGLAVSTLLSLLPQIGEQVDYLRFLPTRKSSKQGGWWGALLATGPGWIVIGAIKLMIGSFLAFIALRNGVPVAQADQPTQMYLVAFQKTFSSPSFALVLTAAFVIVCQLKINVTNAYAGSIAWSNFFSRLTHSHPGRVVWLVFNVLLALLLMEIGIFRAIEDILIIYANFAAGWIGALTADLVINKPLKLSPPGIEFKRAHLYDINPVGVGALLLAVVLSSLAFVGAFGSLMQAWSPLIALLVAFVTAPVIAWYTQGRYYLARQSDLHEHDQDHHVTDHVAEIRCSICENAFERNDIAFCPAYSGPICSLCCTLEARCHDLCKQGSRVSEQLGVLLRWILPVRIAATLHTRAAQFIGMMLVSNALIALLLSLINQQYHHVTHAERELVSTTLWLVYLCLLVLSGIASWLIVLAHENRRIAEAESSRQTSMLMEEIEAHQRTDTALQKAKETAEAANTAKTRYIVGLSHEIRTPLNAISGYAQLLERSHSTPSENAVRVIRRSADHLANLIDGLLDISKIESGMLKLNRDKVNLLDFLNQLVDMFKLQAAASNIEFRFIRASYLPIWIYTDQKRLRQILINLLSNAIKYTQRGHASLAVRYRNQVAEFEISDSGVGIPEEDLERVFEPFERGRSSNVRHIPGTGLGLTITKLLTEIMGGEILVRSSVEVGTTFTVRIALPDATHDTVTTSAPHHICGYRGARIRVLLVDDDTAHLDIVCNLLKPLGFEVNTAASGHEGLTMAQQHHPDLVMLDISMGDMTGWELARIMRTLPELKQTRILMVSANAHEYVSSDEEQPHDGFVMKPVDLQALLDNMARILKLEWEHELHIVANTHMQSAVQPALNAHHHLDALLQLGRIGHVRGIQAKLREIENEDAANKPFVNHMRTLVTNFDLKRYMKTLEGMHKNA